MLISPVSGDLLVKLALGIAVVGGVVYLVHRAPTVGQLAQQAGNAAVDAVVINPVDTAAQAVGGGLIAAVDAVPGLTDYLKRISTPGATPGTSNIGPGVTVLDGQTYSWGY